jgi:hypothetical protein
MTAVPADTPVITPGVGGTVAMAASDEDQVPTTGLVNTTDEPAQTDDRPDGSAGSACTDIAFVAIQPKLVWYVIIGVPAANPVTCPLVSTVADNRLLLLQLPPADDDRPIEEPAHTVAEPVIASGNGFTVITAALIVVDLIYSIVVVPAIIPVTTPVEDIVATLVFELVHVPPDTKLDILVVLPTHTEYEPSISEPVVALTNISFVAVLVPQ